MRRLLLFGILLGILGAAVFTVLKAGRGSTTVDPWKAIPATAPLVFEVRDPLLAWDRWKHTSVFWPRLSTGAGARSLDSALTSLGDLVEKSPGFAGAFSRCGVLAALLPGTDATPRVLFVVSGLDAATGDVVQSTLTDPDGVRLAMRYVDGLLLIATHTAVIDEAGLALAAPAATGTGLVDRQDKPFSTDADARVYVNTTALPRLLETWLDPATIDGLGITAGTLRLDASSRPGTILLSGLFRSENGPAPAMPLARALPPRALPVNTTRFTRTAIGDPDAWLEAHPPNDAGIARTLLQTCDGQVTIAHIATDSLRETPMAVLGNIDPERCARALASLCDSAGCDTARYREQLLVRMTTSNALENALGSDLAAIERPWYAVLGDETVFCDDPSALRSAIDAWVDGNGLAGDLATGAFLQEHGGEAHRGSWWSAPRGIVHLGRQATDAARRSWYQRTAALKAVGQVLLTRSPARNGSSFVTLVIEAAPGSTSSATTMPTEAVIGSAGALWTTDLPAPLARKPWIVRNHVNGTREALVQDEHHALHLLSAAGQLLWSRSLDGPVLGEVRQIDRFRNGKLQLIFNTATAVHLIDRNGRDVPGFPVKLKEGASAPLAVFDYENNRDYRILVPTEEGRVLNIDGEGRAVQGWAPPTLPKVCDEAVRFLRIHGRDHLLVIDGAGGLHIWDRKGAVRYKPKAVLEAAAEVLDVRPGLSIGDTRITWLTTTGSVRATTLDGTAVPVSERPVDRAALATIGNERAMATISAGTLNVTMNGTAMERALAAPATATPVLYDLGARWLVGVLADDGFHLIGADGDETSATPCPATVPGSIADLNLDGRYELLIGEGRKLRAIPLP